MIRTTTTIRGNRMSQSDLMGQVNRVALLVEQATDRDPADITVDVSGIYLARQDASKDKFTAKVVVVEDAIND